MSFEEACEGYGKVPAEFMFVGISAGKLGALVTRVPFTKDSSGRLFQRCLYRLGLSNTPDESSVKPDLNCYVTNLVKGRILTAQGNNRLPSLKEMEYWYTKFLGETTVVQPKNIVAMSDLVWRYFQRKGWRTIGHRLGRLHVVKHPRWYASHGALKPGSEAFEQMVKDYGQCIADCREYRKKWEN